MGFKLGTNRGNYAVSGEIKTKMRFGKDSGGDASVPGVPVIRKPLASGVMGEANMDGSIYISDNIVPSMFASPIMPSSNGTLITGVPGTEPSSPACLPKRIFVLISPPVTSKPLFLPSLNPIIYLYLLSYHL